MTSSEALPASLDGVQIIGIDCAAQPTDFGLARGFVRGGAVEVVEVEKGEGVDNCLDALAERVRGWIGGDGADPSGRTLLALDAPLGWPITMAHALRNHRAGTPLGRPSNPGHEDPNPGNHLFRRHTDRFIAQKFWGAPQDIGATVIARLARSALELLGGLGTLKNGSPGVPLLWNPQDLGRLGAIEVYPRLTLRHLLGTDSQVADPFYKETDTERVENRRKIVEEILPPRLTLSGDHLRGVGRKDGPSDYDDDCFDAVLCVLEGFHFLHAESVGPEHPEAASWLAKETGAPTAASVDDIKTREGWIWFHQEEDHR